MCLLLRAWLGFDLTEQILECTLMTHQEKYIDRGLFVTHTGISNSRYSIGLLGIMNGQSANILVILMKGQRSSLSICGFMNPH